MTLLGKTVLLGGHRLDVVALAGDRLWPWSAVWFADEESRVKLPGPVPYAILGVGRLLTQKGPRWVYLRTLDGVQVLGDCEPLPRNCAEMRTWAKLKYRKDRELDGQRKIFTT